MIMLKATDQPLSVLTHLFGTQDHAQESLLGAALCSFGLLTASRLLRAGYRSWAQLDSRAMKQQRDRLLQLTVTRFQTSKLAAGYRGWHAAVLQSLHEKAVLSKVCCTDTTTHTTTPSSFSVTVSAILHRPGSCRTFSNLCTSSSPPHTTKPLHPLTRASTRAW